jgi:hypothetical protein
MSSGSAPQESKPQIREESARLKCEVIRHLTAYPVQGPGLAGDTTIIQRGAIVWVDPTAWDNQPEVGELVVRFLSGESWFYTDRDTFAHSVRKV